jgi:hypothetical protein
MTKGRTVVIPWNNRRYSFHIENENEIAYKDKNTVTYSIIREEKF